MSINLINYALAKKDWEKAYEDLKVLEKGGRNLIILTDALHGYPSADGTLHSTSAARTPKEYIKVKPGEQYVLSIPYSNLVDNVVRLAQFDESKNFVRRPIYGGGEMEGDVRVHYITIPDNVYYIWPGFASDAKVKLEKGNKATDWTPAPEDINAHPFVAELAETVYRSKQNEERIRNLENALTALGGGS